MGKLKPLRKAKNNSNAKNIVNKYAKLKSDDSRTHKTKVGQNITEDDDEYWETIEADQNHYGNKNENSDYSVDEDDNDDDDDDDDSDSNDDINMEGDVLKDDESAKEFTYDFEFNDIKTEYVESLTVLLKTLFPNPTASYHLANIIENQPIGTAVTCAGENDVFAFASIIPLSSTILKGSLLDTILHSISSLLTNTSNTSNNKVNTLSNTQSSIILQSYINSTSASTTTTTTTTASSNKAQFNTAISQLPLCTNGLLLHTKFSNLPLALIPPLHTALVEDIQWIKQLSMNRIKKTTSSSSNDNNSKNRIIVKQDKKKDMEIKFMKDKKCDIINILDNQNDNIDDDIDASISLDWSAFESIVLFAACDYNPYTENATTTTTTTTAGNNATKSKNNNKKLSSSSSSSSTSDDSSSSNNNNGQKSSDQLIYIDKQFNPHSIIFHHFEDEILYQASDNNTRYLYKSKHASSWIVMSVLSLNNYKKCIHEIEKLV